MSSVAHLTCNTVLVIFPSSYVSFFHSFSCLHVCPSFSLLFTFVPVVVVPVPQGDGLRPRSCQDCSQAERRQPGTTRHRFLRSTTPLEAIPARGSTVQHCGTSLPSCAPRLRAAAAATAAGTLIEACGPVWLCGVYFFGVTQTPRRLWQGNVIVWHVIE